MNHDIEGQFYNRIIGKCPFNGHFVKCQGKNFRSHNMTMLHPKLLYNEVCYKAVIYFIKIGKISAKIHEIGKIKAIFGLGMTPI